MTEPSGSDGEDRLAALAVRLSDRADVTLGHGRRGFGAGTLMIDGRIFALVSDGRLVLKLPAARVSTLIAEARGLPWAAGKATPLREWVAIPEEEPAWLDLANESLTFVGRANPDGQAPAG
jgi:TfoX N-terminal domain